MVISEWPKTRLSFGEISILVLRRQYHSSLSQFYRRSTVSNLARVILKFAVLCPSQSGRGSGHIALKQLCPRQDLGVANQIR